jgi:hypothetical protein
MLQWFIGYSCQIEHISYSRYVVASYYTKKKKVKKCWLFFKYLLGRALARAVSRSLLTAAVRVRVRAAGGGCNGQSGNEVGFSEYFGFPC